MRDHPEIECAMDTGYPSWMQPERSYGRDEDELYEEWRDNLLMSRADAE